jgi:excisionase family DNA binding protein
MCSDSAVEGIPSRWRTPEYVAELLGLDVSTVYRWLNAGKLGGLQFGKKWRVTDDDLKDFVRDQKAKQRLRGGGVSVCPACGRPSECPWCGGALDS